MYRSEVPGYVVLEDGAVFLGFGFGVEGKALGEIVFGTGMTGYQEMVTDPSSHGQLLVFTYPMVGNCGVGEWQMESDRAHARALVVREVKNTNYNRTSPEPWVDWLSAHGVVGVGGVDTRALTRHLREQGTMTACVAAGSSFDVNGLLAAARGFGPLAGRDLVQNVTCAHPYEAEVAERGETAESQVTGKRGFHVVAFDYGIRRSALRCLQEAGCRVTVVPASFSAEQALALSPDGVFLSNGPGDPAPLTYAVEAIRGLLGRVPIFATCLGHELLATAVGLRTHKLRFGHHGVNHPVKNYVLDLIEITSQNHGFAVETPRVVTEALERDSNLSAIRAQDLWLDTDYGPVQVTHLNLNDGTVEGLRLQDIPAFGVQYLPEASPGPHDGRYHFQHFVDSMERAA